MGRFNRGGNTVTPQRGGRGGFNRGGTPSKFNRGGRQDINQSRGGGQFSPRGRGQFSPRGRGGFRGGRGGGGDRGGRGGGFGRGRGQFNRGGFQGKKDFNQENKKFKDESEEEDENASENESDEETEKPKAKVTPAKGILKKNKQKSADDSEEEDEDEEMDDEDLSDEDIDDEDAEESSPDEESPKVLQSKEQAKDSKKQKKESESEGEDEELDDEDEEDEDEDEEDESAAEEIPAQTKEPAKPLTNGKAQPKVTEKTQKKDIAKKIAADDEESDEEDEEIDDEDIEDEDFSDEASDEEEDEQEEEEEDDEKTSIKAKPAPKVAEVAKVTTEQKKAPLKQEKAPPKQEKTQNKPEESKKRTSEALESTQPAKKAKPSVVGEPADKKVLTEELNRKKTRDACTLFVKDLPKKISDDEIKKLSADIKDIRRKSMNCRFGWLIFANEETCEKNYEKLKNATLGGSRFQIDFVGLKSKNKQAQNKEVTAPQINPLELYIGELAHAASVEELKTAFPSATNVTIPKVKHGPMKKHFAFVAFSTPQEARAAFDKSKNLKLGGVEVVVAYARIKNTAAQKKGND